MDVSGTSAATWAAEASKASSVRVETSCDVEKLCRDLSLQCSALEIELDVKLREAEEKSTMEELVASIEEQIRVTRETRLEAVKAVQGLTRMSVDEVKAMKNRPPRIVRRALEAVYTVLHCQRWLEGMRGFDVTKEWHRIQRMLSNDGFVQSVLQFNVAGLDVVPHVVDFLVAKYFPSLPHDVEPKSPCHFLPSSCSQLVSARGRQAPSSIANFSTKIDHEPDVASTDFPLPPLKGPLPSTCIDSPRRRIVARNPASMDMLSTSQVDVANPALPLPPLKAALFVDSARRNAAAELCSEVALSSDAASGQGIPPQVQLDATSMDSPLPLITVAIPAGCDSARPRAASRVRSPSLAGEVASLDTQSRAHQHVDNSRVVLPQPAINAALLATERISYPQETLAEICPSIAGSGGAALTNSSRTPRSSQQGNNNVGNKKCPRPGTLTSIASAKRLEKINGRRASTSTEKIIQEPLDIAAVEYASRACGAMVRWVYEVLREFLSLKALHNQKGSLLSQLGDEYKKTEETIIRLQEEIKRIQEELETWRRRLVEIKMKESETEYARSALAKLSRLEERQYATAPLPFEKFVVGDNASGLSRTAFLVTQTESTISRTGRGGKLRPVLPLNDATPSLMGRGPVAPVARNRSMLDLQPQDRTQNADGAWPPKSRKYLHVMSTPTLSMPSIADEATE